MAIVLTSCNAKNKEAAPAAISTETNKAEQMYSCPMHPEVTGHKGDKCSKCGMELTVPVTEAKTGNSATQDVAQTNAKAGIPSEVNDIVSNYLKVKNALVKDDSNGATQAAKSLSASLNAANSSAVDAKSQKQFAEIIEDSKEHAEHIGANAAKISHQREHFVMLSKDINDLLAITKTDQKLYQDYCPMANDGKGAIWISETKDIKNPYYGASMLKCGSVKKQF